MTRTAKSSARRASPIGSPAPPPIASARSAGDVLFYRQPTLPPGTYTLDVVADDAIAKRGGVSHVAVTVPPQAAGPRVSDLVIVGRTEKLAPGELADDNVLAVSGVQLYPNLGEPLRKSVDRTLSFYAVILPNGTTPTATLTLAQNGQTLATLPITLAPVDAGGRIQQVGQIPLASLPPGTYEVTLTVTGGAAPITRTAVFTVRRLMRPRREGPRRRRRPRPRSGP